MSWLSNFCLAVSCVTSLPFGRPDPAQSIAGLSKYLPAVGLLIGALLVVATQGLQLAAVSHPVAAILLTILWIILSGGIHFDGLMDTADGIFSHKSPDKMLEIMRDSRVGNFGVITGLAVVLIKIAGLLSLSNDTMLCALLLVPAWSRWCETFAIGRFPYARPEGMGKVWHDTTAYPRDVVKAVIVPLLVSVACFTHFGIATLAVVVAAVVSGVVAAYYLQSIVRGHTGDTYGAVVELSEAGALLLLALFH